METLLKLDDNVSIIAATTPRDYTKMFEVQCGSCMVMPLSQDFAPYDMSNWIPMRDMHGIHPASWYHYTGYSQGLWLEYKGVPIARGMRYRPLLGWNADGTPHYDAWMAFGDLKYQTTFCGRFMADVVVDDLKLPLLKHNASQVATLNHFFIPGFAYEDDFLCPLAHSDNNQKDFAVSFHANGIGNHEGPTFRFTPLSQGWDRKSALHIKSSYDWKGYISAKELTKQIEQQQIELSRTFVPNLNRLTKGGDHVGRSKKTEAVVKAG